MLYKCPVCGSDNLEEPAYRGLIASLEICSCCNFQYGFDDESEGITHEQWRNEWIAKGMQWMNSNDPAPVNWNPQEQLLTISIVVP